MELSCKGYLHKHMLFKMCIRWTIKFNRLWLPGVSFELDDGCRKCKVFDAHFLVQIIGGAFGCDVV